jgi:hypothetical protein
MSAVAQETKLSARDPVEQCPTHMTIYKGWSNQTDTGDAVICSA